MGCKVKDGIEQFTKLIHRDGFKELYDYMVSIGFYEAPASSGNHCDKAGGLAEHTLNVIIAAEGLAEILLSKEIYNEYIESVIIAAFCHDLGKCGDYGKSFYIENVLKSGNISSSKPFKRNPDLLPVDHATRSLCIVNRFMDLTESEEFAIRFHDGLYEPANYALKGNETALYIILHTADLWSSHIVEK